MDDKTIELDAGEFCQGGDELFIATLASKFRFSLVGVLASIVGNSLLP
jgi:hypothetical protein